MDLCMVRDAPRNRLVPATAVDDDLLKSLRVGARTPMQVEIRFLRTSKLNRWYRGLVARVAEGIGAAPDALHAELKFKAGLIQQIIAMPRSINVAVTGPAVAIRLRSTAFPEMADDEFSRYVDFAVEIMYRDYMAHIRRSDAVRLINEWVGRRPKLDPPPVVRAA